MKRDLFQSYNEDIQCADLPRATSYLAGNQLVLAQQGIDSSLLSLHIQTAALGKSPKNDKVMESIVYSQGIQGSFGSAAWFEIELEGRRLIRLIDPAIEHTTGYEENILPRTRLTLDELEIEVSSLTPIRKLGRGVERMPGLFYSLKIKNPSKEPILAQVRLCLKGSAYLVKGGEGDWWMSQPGLPVWDASLGGWIYPAHKEISLVVKGGKGAQPKFNGCPVLSWEAHLKGDSEQEFTGLFIFKDTATIAGQAIQTGSIQDWKAVTIQYWWDILGKFDASWAKQFPAFLQRAVQEALLCVRVDLDGNVVGIAPSPVPVDEYPLLCDVLWISLPALYLQPELYQQMIEWYVGYLVANEKEAAKDIRTRVIPAVMMGLGYRITGRKDLFVETKELSKKVEYLLGSIEGLDLKFSGLYPTERIRKHKPLMSIELGANILCWAAFDLWGRLCSEMGRKEIAARWHQAAQETHSAIQEKCVVRGPGETGFLLAGLIHGDPANPHQHFLYYEDDALEIAIAPYLGFCSSRTPIWIDTMNYMFTAAYDLVHIIPDTFLWWELWNYHGFERQEKFTYPSILARINSIEDSDVELDRALIKFNQEIGVNGALWEKTKDGKRLMRSGRLCGAAYLVFLDHILGIRLDGVQKKASFMPFTTWRTADLTFNKEAAIPFEIQYRLGQDRAMFRLVNKTSLPWQVRAGFWFPAGLLLQKVEVNRQTPPYAPAIEPLNKWQDVLVDSQVAGDDTLEINLEMYRAGLVYSPFSPADQENF